MVKERSRRKCNIYPIETPTLSASLLLKKYRSTLKIVVFQHIRWEFEIYRGLYQIRIMFMVLWKNIWTIIYKYDKLYVDDRNELIMVLTIFTVNWRIVSISGDLYQQKSIDISMLAVDLRILCIYFESFGWFEDKVLIFQCLRRVTGKRDKSVKLAAGYRNDGCLSRLWTGSMSKKDGMWLIFIIAI